MAAVFFAAAVFLAAVFFAAAVFLAAAAAPRLTAGPVAGSFCEPAMTALN